jgi:hypothetical protein
MDVQLPRLKVGERHTIDAHGTTLVIKRISFRAYCLKADNRPHVRWSDTLPEVRSEVAHFLATGALPPPAGTSWA